MKTLTQKIKEYRDGLQDKGYMDSTTRVAITAAITKVLHIAQQHEDPTFRLREENEDNLFWRKIYCRFSIALVGVIIIILLWK